MPKGAKYERVDGGVDTPESASTPLSTGENQGSLLDVFRQAMEEERNRDVEAIGTGRKPRDINQGRIYLSTLQKGIFCVGLLVTCVVIVFLARSPETQSYMSGKDTLKIDDLWSGKYQAHTRSISWLQSEAFPDGTYMEVNGSEIYVASWPDVDKKTILMESNHFRYGSESHVAQKIALNHNATKALLTTDSDKNWRHSSFSYFWVLDIESGQVEPLDLAEPNDKISAKASIAHWSPDGAYIAFVRSNNLFLRDVSSSSVKQITTDGGTDLFYGRPDWVYEEEVFGGDSALWWSNTGKHLAVLRTNETTVAEYTIPYFVGGKELEQYPDMVEIKYPKPGTENPYVSLMVLDVESQDFFAVKPEQDPKVDDIITNVFWGSDTKLLVHVTDREGDSLKVSVIDAADESRTGKVVRSENMKELDGGWYEIAHNARFVPKSEENGRPDDGYVDEIVVDGYTHFGYFSPLDSSEPKVLTSGNWDVDSSSGAVDLSTNTLYYLGREKSPIERHLYSVKLDGTNKKNITEPEYEGYHSVSFSFGSRYALLTYLGPGVPYQKMLDLHVENPIKEGVMMESNSDLSHRIDQAQIPSTRFNKLQIDGFGEGEEPLYANFAEVVPPGFTERGKYPVLFYMYQGPGSQTVTKQFGVDFQKIISSQLNAVVVTIDGRGTGFMGRKFKSVVRDKLGYYETMDQVTGAKYWASLPYVDEKRMAIWGWSYGGFMTLKTLERDGGEHFSYGMAVAPVTDWRLYDSIYTERYMHTPQHNSAGYVNASVHDLPRLEKVDRFLIMHGTGDDNVHFQNTLVLLDKFDLEGLENYDVHVFPDSDHSIRYHNANKIVYDKLETWITNAFKGNFDSLVTA